MGEADEWTIGTLRQEDFSHIENVLVGKKIANGILTLENFPAELKDFLAPYDILAAQCINSAKQRYMPSADITHCFVSTPLSNAFATRTPDAPGRYFIAFLGGVTVMNPIFDAMLRDNDVRSFLGLGDIAPDDNKHDHQLNVSTLDSLSFRWLAYHEIGHIKNGHLHLGAKDGYGLTTTEEMQATGEEDDNLTRHTLEMDADGFACGQVFGEMFSMEKERTADWPLFQNDERKIKSFYIAMYTMLRSFEARDWTAERQYLFSHPHAFIRVAQLGAIGQVYSQRANLDIKPQQWITLSTECMGVCEASLRARGFRPLPDALATYFKGDQFKEYGRRILARWARIRPALLPYLLGGELAAAQEPPA